MATNKGKEPANESQGSSSSTTRLPKKALSSSIHNKKSVHVAKAEPKNKFAPSKNAPNNGASSSKRKVDWDTWNSDCDDEWTKKIPFCPTFRPSIAEFEDPYAYIHKIAPKASKYGICKIVSPLSPSEHPASVHKHLKFRAQYVYLNTKFREEANFTPRVYNIEEFEYMADQHYLRNYDMPARYNISTVEKDFWKKVENESNEAIEYVNGLEASVFYSDCDDPLGSSDWNLQNFARHPESALRHLKKEKDKFAHHPESALRHLKKEKDEDVTQSKIYIGMLYSYDFWHAEPGHLNRIEYHHYGAPKTWYGIPSKAASDFEKVVHEFVFPKMGFQIYEAHDVINQKAMLFSPRILVEKAVPIYKAEQNPGEFIITFPKTYHTGFSNGFNCVEAVNFTTRDWFSFGAEASERRALYKQDPIIPYQELLCKEAESLYYDKQSEINSPSYQDLKLYFACLIRLHHFACEEIRKSGTTVALAPHNKIIKKCETCQRECYLAYVTCRCYPEPTCIFHDIYRGCRCKRKRVMWVKEEILELQNIATRFEDGENERFLNEVKTLLERFSEVIACLPSMNLRWSLEELIKLEAVVRKVSAAVSRRQRTNYSASGVA